MMKKPKCSPTDKAVKEHNAERQKILIGKKKATKEKK